MKDFGAKGDGITDDSNAIQAALTALKTIQTNAYSVLYFPAGTASHHEDLGHHADVALRVSGRPDHRRRSSEHHVRLGWTTRPEDAEPRLWYAKVSRFTFDGKGKASVGLYRGENFSTVDEMSDLRFRDMATGINSAAVQEQDSPSRCRNRFERMSKYGILSDNFNTLNVWIWHITSRTVTSPSTTPRATSISIGASFYARRWETSALRSWDRSRSSATRPSVRRTSSIGRANIPGARAGLGSGKPHLRHPRRLRHGHGKRRALALGRQRDPQSGGL